jgi:FkbM family methyltransferase
MLKSAIQKTANLFGYEFRRVSTAEAFPAIDLPFINVLELIVQDYLQQSGKQHEDIFFIQIGAHDGSSADPVSHLIQKYKWSGLLVEPQPSAFQTLQTTYRDQPQIRLENAVISTEDGVVPFYTVRQDIADLSFWISQAASLNRNNVLGALHYWRNLEQITAIPEDLESAIVELPLPAFTLPSLLAKHQIQQFDLLVLDTTGFDFEIIKMVPFSQIKPPIIHFEPGMLPIPQQQECFQLLANQGYGLAKVAVDTIAYLHSYRNHWKVTSW